VFPSPVVDATAATTAIAPNGFAAAAWVETLPGGQSQVDVSVRPPGGDWSAPQPLGATTMTLSDVHLAIDSAGDAALAWQAVMSPSTFVANVTTRQAGGSFGAPETVSNGDVPRVGLDAAGNVTFVYSLVNSGASNGEFVREAPAGSPLMNATPHTLSSTCFGFDADLAVAPSGDAIVGFSCSDAAFALRRGGIWGSAATPFIAGSTACPTIAVNASYSGVRVAIDAQGHPIGAVQETDTQNDCMGGFFNTRQDLIDLALPAGGQMAAGPTVAQSGIGLAFGPVPNDVTLPTVGIGGGSAVVGWRAFDSNGFHSQQATRTYTGNGSEPPGAVQLLGDPNSNVGESHVSVGPIGQALLTWTAAPPLEKLVVFEAFSPAGGAFDQALEVSDGADHATSLSSAIDDAGDGVVGWLEAQGSTHAVHARGFDVTPPQLTTVSVSASAQVGVPAAVSAQAFDLWGPVTFSWNFGDGTATGADTSHSFLAAGPHTVTVTATDSAGNATSRSGTVVVGAAPGGGGTTLRPTLTKVSQTNRVFRVGARPTAIVSAKRRRVPIGTTFHFSLNQAATVKIAISQSMAGRRSGKRCVKPSKRLAHNKRCTRIVTKGVLTRHGQPGANSIAFSGRIGRRPLKPGLYRVTFVANAHGASSTPKVLRFKIVR
jgi:hypothetical protein